MKPSTLSLLDARSRKYINQSDRVFLNAAGEVDGHIRTLAVSLTYTGCRKSEALSVTVFNLDVKIREKFFQRLVQQQQLKLL